MIQLQGRQVLQALTAADLSNLIVEPLTLIAGAGLKPVVLTQSASLGQVLEGAAGIIERLEADGTFQDGGWRVVKRGSLAYQGGRVLYDCLAIKLRATGPPPLK